MTDINSVIVTGRVTRDIGERDFTYLSSGTAKLQFSIAVNKSVKNPDGSWGEKAAFFNVVVWGKYAESLRSRLAKGAKVTVSGLLEQDTWEDKQTKARREKVYITAANVQLVQSPPPHSAQPAQTGQAAARQEQQAAPQSAEFEDDWPPDSVPF